MTRLNLVLAGVLVICALSLVTSQYKARALFVALQQEKDQEKQMQVEWGQLQLEQSTWAMHSRIEKIAVEKLHMKVPEQNRIQIVNVSSTTEGMAKQ